MISPSSPSTSSAIRAASSTVPLMHRTGRSFHLPNGAAIYFDTGVIEIASPVMELERGCFGRLARSMEVAIAFVREQLDRVGAADQGSRRACRVFQRTTTCPSPTATTTMAVTPNPRLVVVAGTRPAGASDVSRHESTVDRRRRASTPAAHRGDRGLSARSRAARGDRLGRSPASSQR